MSDRIIIIQLGPQTDEVPTKKGTGIVGRDVWRFNEIRQTLWGTGTSTRSPNDVWDFPGIRKRLWGW